MRRFAGIAMAAALVATGCAEDKSGPPSNAAEEKALEQALSAPCPESYTLDVMGADTVATPDANGAHMLKGTISLGAKGSAPDAKECLDQIRRSAAIGHQQMMEIVVDDFRRREVRFQELEQERLRLQAAARMPSPDGGVDMRDHSRPTEPIEAETILFRVEGQLRRWNSGWKAENIRIQPMPGYQTSY